jgi:serine/threonine protein kinase
MYAESRGPVCSMEMTQFLRFAVGLATALSRLHKRGLIHKNVKPTNVLVNSATGEVWLMGFGQPWNFPDFHRPTLTLFAHWLQFKLLKIPLPFENIRRGDACVLQRNRGLLRAARGRFLLGRLLYPESRAGEFHSTNADALRCAEQAHSGHERVECSVR